MRSDRRKIELAMARACLEPKDLITRAAMPRPTLNKVLSGSSVRPATLGRVARALGVDVSEIVEEGVVYETIPENTRS